MNISCFDSDPFGRRILKISKPCTAGVPGANTTWTYTYYVNDASGNVMATYSYDKGASAHTMTLDEQMVYGSSRLGLRDRNKLLSTFTISGSVLVHTSADETQRTLGSKRYEYTNHLGNVLLVTTDRKMSKDPNTNGTTDYYHCVVDAYYDYGPFGNVLEGRTGGNGYRYGFNSQENENALYGTNNATSAEYWMYDARLGRRWNVDPVTYPWQSPYAAFNNNPIYFSDPLGLEGTGGSGDNTMTWGDDDCGGGDSKNYDRGQYSIQSGDNFWNIESKLGINHGTLQSWNPDANANNLKVGQLINTKSPEETYPVIYSAINGGKNKLPDEGAAWNFVQREVRDALLDPNFEGDILDAEMLAEVRSEAAMMGQLEKEAILTELVSEMEITGEAYNECMYYLVQGAVIYSESIADLINGYAMNLFISASGMGAGAGSLSFTGLLRTSFQYKLFGFGYGLFGSPAANAGYARIGKWEWNMLYSTPNAGWGAGTLFSLKHKVPNGFNYRIDIGVLHGTSQIGFHSIMRASPFGIKLGDTKQRTWYGTPLKF